MTPRLIAFTLAGLLLAPQMAHGYAIEVHKDFFDLAFNAQTASARRVTPPSQGAINAFRVFVYEHARKNAKFLQRWPTEASFTPAAFKEFLSLNPGKNVVAIDHVPARANDVRTVVREGSVDPDNDDRNQDRLFLQQGKVTLDPFGRAVPYDPRTTWFGGLTGTPSQFDAHGATLRTGKKGSGIMTAIRNPEQFARPAVVLGSAPDFSETYTELAMVAQLWGAPGSEWMALSFGGNNMHGIEDLGNQIHTTVLGTWKFFWDAKKAYYKFKMKSFFKKKANASSRGYTAPSQLTPQQVNDAMAKIKVGKEDEVDKTILFALGKEPKGVPSDTELGIQIIGNHHRLLEDFVQDLYIKGRDAIAAGRPQDARDEVRLLIQVAKAGDAAFEAKCRAALSKAGLGSKDKGLTPFARVIAEVMIEHSAPEAQPIYEAIRAVSKKVTKNGGTYDKKLGHAPLDFLEADTPDNKHVRKVWDLTGKAWARVVTAIRLWDETFRAETSDLTPGSAPAIARAEQIILRLADRQIAALEAAEARRAAYLATKQAEWKKTQEPKRGFFQRIKGWFR
jgi:hypothetical protein